MSADASSAPPLAALALEDFAPLVGDAFQVGDPGIELRLDQARPGTAVVPNGRAPFALEFVGPKDRPLSQRIHGLAHPQLGSLDLFLVPVASDEGGIRYEAVFS